MKKKLSLLFCVAMLGVLCLALALPAAADTPDALAGDATCDAVLIGYQNQVNGNGVRLVAEISHMENYKVLGFEFTWGSTTVTRTVSSVFKTLIAANDDGDTYDALTADEGKYLFALTITDLPATPITLTVAPFTVDLEGNRVAGESQTIAKAAVGGFRTAPRLTLSQYGPLEGSLSTGVVLPTATATDCFGNDLSVSVSIVPSEGLTVADGKATSLVAGNYTVTYTVTDPAVDTLTASETVSISLVENGVTVGGTLQSATYTVGGNTYALYALDYSKATVTFIGDASQYAAVIAENGSYTVTLPAGTYTVRYTYPNFVCPDTQVVVDESGLTAATEQNAHLTVKIPLVADSTTVNGSTVSAGNVGKFDYSGAENYNVTLPKGYDDDAYLVGTEGTVVLFEAVLRNAVSNGTGTATRYQAGLIISAFMNGTSKTRDAILFDLTNAVSPYTGNLVRPWLKNGWNNNAGLVGDIAGASGMQDDAGVKLTLVRVNTVAYVFVNDQFVTLVTGLQGNAGALGFQTLSKTGLTYSNYLYSYNTDLINAKIAASLEIPASVENATLSADKTEGVKLGDTVTLTLTPTAGYTVDQFLVNGEDMTASLVESGGVYTLAYKVTAPTVTVKVTVKSSGSET